MITIVTILTTGLCTHILPLFVDDRTRMAEGEKERKKEREKKRKRKEEKNKIANKFAK